MDGWGCQEHQAVDETRLAVSGDDAVGPGPIDVRFKLNTATGDLEVVDPSLQHEATVEDLHRAVEHMAMATRLSRNEVKDQLAMFGVPSSLLFGTSPSGFEHAELDEMLRQYLRATQSPTFVEYQRPFRWTP